MAVTERSDTDLLDRARTGDEAALSELYVRHRPAALRLARSYGNRADAEDLVNGAFERVLAALRRGHGPTEAFRPYLFVTVRRLAANRAAAGGDATLDEVPEAIAAADDPSVIDLTDRHLVAEAFASLPDRWQTVLWHTAIEGRRPHEVARATGMPANTVAVLAHRARERLRQTYLQAHVGEASPPACVATRSNLGGYVRGTVPRRSRAAVEGHLAGCEPCRALTAELQDVNRLLARAVAPFFAAGGAAETWLGAGAGSGGPVGGVVGAGAGGATNSGAVSAVGGTAASGAVGAGFGVAGVVKVAAAVAAVAGLVAATPLDLIGSGDDPDDVAIAAGTLEGTADDRGEAPPTTAPARTATPVPTTGADGSGTGAPPAVDVDVDLGSTSVAAGVELSPLPGTVIEAQAGGALGEGVDLSAAWRSGLLGTGQLVVEVLNRDTSPLSQVELLVDLSPAARATSLLGDTCRAGDGGLLGVDLALVRSLVCELPEVAAAGEATLSLPVSVSGTEQAATVRLMGGGAEVASTVVQLTV